MNRNDDRGATLRSEFPLPEATEEPANTAAVVEGPDVAPTPVIDEFDPEESTEVADLRARHERTYANPDGTETTEFSSTPLNFQADDGSWTPVDARMVPTGEAEPEGWRNVADEVALHFAERADAETVAEMRLDDEHSVAFTLRDAAASAGRMTPRGVLYESVAPHTDLLLESQAGAIKETLILKSSEAPRSFAFPLRLSGLTPELVEGHVVLRDEAGGERARIPAGFMIDAGREATAPATRSDEVTYRLEQGEGGWILHVDLDDRWLSDPARQYPVEVDPTVMSTAATASLSVHKNGVHVGDFQVGRSRSSAHAGYLAFGNVAARLRHHTIFGAQLVLTNYNSASCRPRAVTVHAVRKPWPASGRGLKYPGPEVGRKMGLSTFAHGYIATGSSRSACKTQARGIKLGKAGRDLVQRWADGRPNYGLSVRASSSDRMAWKKFAGAGTANAPSLYVTHTPFNAGYVFKRAVPRPAVLQNQAGNVEIQVTNRGAHAWQPGTYHLLYRIFDSKGKRVGKEQRSADLTTKVERNGKVTLSARIRPLPPGRYRLDFSMQRSGGGAVFTDEGVPPIRLQLQVPDLQPVMKSLYPVNGYQSPTLTPQLWARALDIDAPKGSQLEYRFEVCDRDDAGKPVECTTSRYSGSRVWTVPAKRLTWGNAYLWRAFTRDGSSEVASPRVALLASVPQPELASRIGGSPQGSSDREFDPQTGNYTTSAVDATVATVGPPLSVVRTYNSLDPRRDTAFGAGWVTKYDMRVTYESGTGGAVVTYPDGQQVRFGRNADGTYSAPAGRDATLTLGSGTSGWRLTDKSGNSYRFDAEGRATRYTDVGGRALELQYGADGKLARAVSMPSGKAVPAAAERALSFSWSGDHVASVTSKVGDRSLTWRYTYDGDLLTRVCDPMGGCTGYDYTGASHYRSVVLDSRPDGYWRVGEDDGGEANSEVDVNLGEDRATLSGVALGMRGAVAGDPNSAAFFTGLRGQMALPKGTLKKTRDLAVEMWFRARNDGGGPLIGYQDKSLGSTSSTGVPLLYIGTDGRLRGQFRTTTIDPITTAGSVLDGAWHHVVLSSNAGTQTLFLDGKRVGTLKGSSSHTSLTQNQVGAAYASTPSRWPAWGPNARRHFAGMLDEVAVYSAPLTAATVATHFREGSSASSVLTQVTLPSGKVAAEVSYDAARDRVQEHTDSSGGTWRLGAPEMVGGADDLRRIVHVVDPAGFPHAYEFDALAGRLVRLGSPVAVRPWDGAEEQGDTGGEGSRLEAELEKLAYRTFGYDDRGFPSKITDENGNTVTFRYDARGNLETRRTCRTSGDCQTARYTYPKTGSDIRRSLPLQTRDARSSGPDDDRFRTAYAYDDSGLLLKQINADGSTVTNTYSTGKEVAVNGGSVPPDLLLSTTDAKGAVITYRYFASGDVASVTGPTGLRVDFAYDELGRKTRETRNSEGAEGVTSTYTYDDLSRLATTTEAAATNRITGVRQQQQTSTVYDADGMPVRIEVRDIAGNTPARATTYEWNQHNKVSQIVDAAGNESTLTYDEFGNVTTTVDARGTAREFRYTSRNALAEVRLLDWTGDPEGAPASGDVLTLNAYAYDAAGRMIRHTDAMGRTVAYDHYDDDLLKSVTLLGFHNPDGTTRDFVLERNEYDAAGNLVRRVGGNGTVVTATSVDALGRPVHTVDGNGGETRTTQMTYDKGGNVTRVSTTGTASNVPWEVDAKAETVVDYTYDRAGRMVAEASAAGDSTFTTKYRYDQRGLLTAVVKPRGNDADADAAAHTTSFSYDELGRRVEQQDPPMSAESGGREPQNVRPLTRIGYDAYDNVTHVVDPLGRLSLADYDTLGRLAKVTAPPYTPPGATEAIVPTVAFRYDELGNLVEQTDPRGVPVKYGYDQLNRLAWKDVPVSTAVRWGRYSFDYTRVGEVLSVTDPSGARREATYDDLDRQITSTVVDRAPRLDNFTSRLSYDDAGNVVGATSPGGVTTTNSYDALGQLTRSVDAHGVAVSLGYDAVGRQVRASDGLGRTKRSWFDGAGRLTQVGDVAAGKVLRSESFAYDADDNLVARTNPKGDTTRFSYDAAGRLTSQVEPVSAEESIRTTFGYDAAGNRTRYTDGRGNSTLFTHNALGLPEHVVEPATAAHPDAAARTWTASYDAVGNAVRLAAPGGVVRDRTYDRAGRLVRETGSSAESPTAGHTWSYDAAGRPVKVGDNAYTYNDRGLLLQASGPSGNATYSYDRDGLLTGRTDAAGSASFAYAKGRLSSVTDGVTSTTQKVGYDKAGEVTSVDYGLGRVRRLGYDGLGRPASDVLTNAAGAEVASTRYEFDAADRLTRKTTAGVAGAADNRYGYDSAGRLTSWGVDGAKPSTTQYRWDASGNRVQAGDRTAAFDERNRLLSDGRSEYSYTPRGTLQSKTTDGVVERSRFDAFDRLVGVGEQVYTYDGSDRLLTRNGRSFSYAGFSLDPVADGSSSFARGPANELLAIAQGNDKRLQLTDGHGDVVGGFDPADATLSGLPESTSYDPFGQVTGRTGPTRALGYQGDWTDPETGAVDMGARWYQPGTGTFSARDSVQYSAGPSAFANRYTYGAASPMNYDDPDGRWPCISVSFGSSRFTQQYTLYDGCADRGMVTVEPQPAPPMHMGDGGGGGSSYWGPERGAGGRGSSAGRGGGRGSSATRGGGHGRGHHAAPSRQRTGPSAAELRARAQAVTRQAQAQAATSARHHSLRIPSSATRELYPGGRGATSSPHVMPKEVASYRSVVDDNSDAAREIVRKARSETGSVVGEASASRKSWWDTAKEWAPLVAGIAAGGAVTAGCIYFSVFTAGLLIPGCVALGFVVGGAVEGGLSCPPGRSVAGCVVRGGIAGGIGGLGFAVGSAFGGPIAGGMASAAAMDAATQYMETGTVDWRQTAFSGALGGVVFLPLGRILARVRPKPQGAPHSAPEGSPPQGAAAGGKCGNSFTGDTPVLVDRAGTEKPIRKIRVGDKVVATDAASGRSELRTVTAVLAAVGHRQMTDVTLSDGSRISATEEHPFWNADLREFVYAKNLRVGEKVRQADGSLLVVRGTRHYARTLTAYNLTVEGLHTYYAGETPVLVHNCGGRGFAPGKWLSHFEKHGHEFGYKNSVEYLRGAQQLTRGGPGVSTFTRGNGDTLFYRSADNSFGVTTANGTIRTYFKPQTGAAYWTQQTGMVP